MEFLFYFIIGIFVFVLCIYFLCYIRGILWSISFNAMIKNYEKAYNKKITIIIDKIDSRDFEDIFIEKL